MNGAFVGGNKLYTMLFLWEGEYILVNGSSFHQPNSGCQEQVRIL